MVEAMTGMKRGRAELSASATCLAANTGSDTLTSIDVALFGTTSRVGPDWKLEPEMFGLASVISRRRKSIARTALTFWSRR